MNTRKLKRHALEQLPLALDFAIELGFPHFASQRGGDFQGDVLKAGWRNEETVALFIPWRTNAKNTGSKKKKEKNKKKKKRNLDNSCRRDTNQKGCILYAFISG